MVYKPNPATVAIAAELFGLWLTERGLSDRQAAALFQVEPMTLGRWRRGLSVPRYDDFMVSVMRREMDSEFSFALAAYWWGINIEKEK